MSEQRLNIELFKKIRDKIASVPAAYDQEEYGRPEQSAPCGTACCIAGWACVLGDAVPLDVVRHAAIGDQENIDRGLYKLIPAKAEELLGISPEEAHVLFTSMPQGEYDEDEDEDEDTEFLRPAWPEPFSYQWEFASKEQQAEIAVAYLDHIIETGKVLE